MASKKLPTWRWRTCLICGQDVHFLDLPLHLTLHERITKKSEKGSKKETAQGADAPQAGTTPL